MSQQATDDGPVLAAVWELLLERDQASQNEVLAKLGWSIDKRIAVLRSMKRLIDNGYLVGKVLTGDATLQDVTATSVTEKGVAAVQAYRARLGLP